MRSVVESFYLNQFLQNLCVGKSHFGLCKKIHRPCFHTLFPNKLGAKVLTHRQDYYPSKKYKTSTVLDS